MKVSQLYPSRFLKGIDLGDRRVTVTMDEVTIEKMAPDGVETEEPVLWFVKATKGLVLNKTNATTIAKLYGDETENWRGKRITLYAKNNYSFGKQQLVVVVHDRMPAASPPPSEEGEEHEQAGDDSPA